MSQQLILPFAGTSVFSAGYKNAAYLKQQGYHHYGVDIFGDSNNQQVHALGSGTVIACGMDGGRPTQRLGNCIVIVYKDVQLHDGSVRDLACRMYHFASIAVTKGQAVKRGTVLGVAGNTGSTTVLGKPMGIHLHIEFDRDTDYPQYAYGISGNGAIIKCGTVDSTVNPSDVWYRGDGQFIWGKYPGWYTDADVDLPRATDVQDPGQNDVEALQKRIHTLEAQLAQAIEDKACLLADIQAVITKYQ